MRHPKESVIRLLERGRGGVGLCDSAWEGGTEFYPSERITSCCRQEKRSYTI
jgi:hypothetical protein